MKRMRLKNDNKINKTAKRAAIKKVQMLVNEGLTLNQARISVGAEYNMTSSGIAYWEKTLGTKATKSTNKTVVVANTKAMTTSTSNNLAKVTKGLTHLQGSLGIVFDSLINKDGQFTNQDASSISTISSNILNACKQSLLERKYHDSMKKKAER